MGIETVVLLGRDYPTLGEIHVAELGPHIALGISAGKYPKAYPSKEPNEDCAMAATDGTNHLLAVADGHNGFEAAEAVVTALAEHAEPLLSEPTESGDRIRDLCIQATRGALSGTTATVAAITPDSTVIWSAGDSAAIDLTGKPRQLTTTSLRQLTTTSPFLHDPTPPPPLERQRPGHLLLVTDGVTNFLPRNRDTALTGTIDKTPIATVQAVLELSFEGAAGDNTTAIFFQHA